MDIFKSKEEKAMIKKMAIKKSMNVLRKRIAYLEKQEQKYVEAARISIREQLPAQIELAKQAVKITVEERKRTYKMLLNAEIISQMKDMNSMTTEFLSAVESLSKDIAKGTTANMSKIKRDLEIAMEKTSAMTEELEEMLDDAQDNIESFETSGESVSDEDIDRIIYGRSSENEEEISIEDINKQLEELSK